MKTRFILSVIFTLCSVSCALSQVPQGFNYQAIARDALGNPIVNTIMPVRITIQSELTGGTVFWQELHSSVTTNSFGMLTLVVGQGVKQSGTAATFADIDWSVTPKYIKTEIDYGGWKEMGVSPLWSVPYAQLAKSSEQWQISGANIYRATGNVGIGTASPTYKLDVNGEIASRTATSFRLRNTSYSTLLRNDNNDFFILLTNSGDPDGTWNSLRPLRINLATGNTYFGNGVVTVNHGGNVGIGTGSPGALLTVGSNLGGTAASTTFKTNAGALGTTSGNTLKLSSIGFTSTNYTSLGIEARRTASGSDWMTTAIGLKFDVDNVSPVNNSEIWLTAQGKLGLGTPVPSGKFSIQTPSTWDDNIPIFEVKNKLGVPVLAVYNNGIRILVEDTDDKGVKGGFAIGGFDPTKAPGDETFNLMMVSPDSIRFTIDNRASKGVKGGFAIGSFDESKATVKPKEFMSIIPETSSTTDIANSTYIGYQAGKNTKGWANTFIGKQAGLGLTNNQAANNIFIGEGAGRDNYGRFYFETRTLPNGMVIRLPVWTGGGNISIGNYSGAKLYGNNAGEGMDNILIGNYAGNSMTTGAKNVFIGYEAGAKNVLGMGNVFIGYQAGYNETGSNKLYIANSSTSTPLIYGDFSTYELIFNAINVAFAAGGDRYIILPDKTKSLFIGGKSGSQSAYAIHLCTDDGANNGVPRISILEKKVGIGVTNPAYRLDLPNIAGVDGQARANAWITYSDGRAKTEQDIIKYGLSEVMRMSPKSYFHHDVSRKDGKIEIKADGAYDIGLVAQEVYELIPEAVTRPENEQSDLWSLSYDKLVPVLVRAIQEQQQQIETLKQRLSALEEVAEKK